MRPFISWSVFIILIPVLVFAQSDGMADDLLGMQVQFEVGQPTTLETWMPDSDSGLDQAGNLEIKGMQYEARFDLRHAVDTYLRCLSELSASTDAEAQYRVSARLGHVLSQLQEWTLAEDYFARAAAIRDPVWRPWALYWSAQHLQRQGVIGISLDTYGEAIDAFQSSSQLIPAQRISFAMGNMHAQLGNWDQAESYFLMSGDLALQLDKGQENARVSQALAWMYLQMGEEGLAGETARSALLDLDDRDPVLRARLGLIAARAEMGSGLTADFLARNEAQLLQSSSFMEGMEKYYLEKSEILDQSGEVKEALFARKKYDMFRDSALALMQSNQAAQLVTRFQSEMQVKDQESRIVQLQAEKVYHRTILYLLMGLSLALIGLMVALYLRYNQKRKDHALLVEKNRLIEEQRDEIAQKNDELQLLNERLISEIADREYLEHTQEQNAHYLAALSQELRNPLQSIQGITGELMTAGDMDAHHQELFRIRSATQDIVQYLNDLLDKARLESGKIIFASEPFDPVQTIEDTLSRFEDLSERRKISLQLHADESAEVRFVGDPIRLTQILSNLLRVVFQQLDLKAITISLKTREGDTADRRILDVDLGSDGRVEHPDLLREVLTAPLEKGTQKPGAYYNGQTGLLLSRRLVELQDGLLLLETQANSTHLRIWLPYTLAESGNLEVQGEGDDSLLRGKNILLAEDNRLNQWVVSKVLEEKGARVLCCDDGIQALDAFRQEAFDLVIMDLQMPEMDGYRTTQSIRKMADQQGVNVPILAMTASAYVVSQDKASLFSMDDYLGKPFDRSALLTKVIGLIGKTVKV